MDQALFLSNGNFAFGRATVSQPPVGVKVEVSAHG
jgi:hypothetical protein